MTRRVSANSNLYFPYGTEASAGVKWGARVLRVRSVSASFTMDDRTCCVWFMTIVAPTSRSCTRGAAAVIRARARAANAAVKDGARGGGMPSAGTSS